MRGPRCHFGATPCQQRQDARCDDVEAGEAATSTAADPPAQKLGDEDGGAQEPRADQGMCAGASSGSLATFGDDVVALIPIAGGGKCVFLTVTGARGQSHGLRTICN